MQDVSCGAHFLDRVSSSRIIRQPWRVGKENSRKSWAYVERLGTVYMQRPAPVCCRFVPWPTPRVLSSHATFHNQFNTRRHLIAAAEHCQFRELALQQWRMATV